MSIEVFEGVNPKINETAFVHDKAVVIGKVEIGADSSIWPGAVLRGDVNKITIGRATSIQDGSVLHVTHDGPYTPGGRGLIIGDNVTVGHSVTLHACTINNNCLIGIGSIILDNAILQNNVLLGAGSLVPPNKTLESGYLWLGNPVKKIRKLTDEEISFFEYSAKHYVKLKNKYL